MEDLLKQQRASIADETTSLARVADPVDLAAPGAGPVAVPAPYDSDAEGPLSDRERNHLAVCESAVDVLRRAFTAAGKALQVIRDARLYRETHATFEDYCRDRWGMTRQQASRLIQAWPLAEALSPIGDKINEAQVRVLLPLADRHGTEAAVTVYQTVAEADDVRVTAGVLKDAAHVVLDETEFDHDRAVEQIRRYLAGDLVPAAPAAPRYTAELDRLRSFVQRDRLRAVANEHPDEVRRIVTEVIDELRGLLNDIETTSG